MNSTPEIKACWKKHPLYAAGVIELVPTQWVWNYRGSDVSPMADLMDGTLVTLDELWEHLLVEGMHEPLIMRIGLRNKKFRLESGNHRIQLFHNHHISHVPVAIQLRDECGPHVADVMTDATVVYNIPEDIIVHSIENEYASPSTVFASLKGNTFLP